MIAPIVTYRRFEPRDLVEIEGAPSHMHLGDRLMRLSKGETLAQAGLCWTALAARTGTILMCGGSIRHHEEHVQLWSVLAPESRCYMTALTRAVRAHVAGLPQRRVDAHVRAGFNAGRRWMALLGLSYETQIADFFPDGEDAILYRKTAT